MVTRFDPETIEKLFGKEAAENEDVDRLKGYFLKGRTYQDIRANLPLRLLVAHKGIGKSALFKICAQEDRDANILALWVRPDDLLQIPFPDTDEINALIRHWKVGLLEIVAKKIVEYFGDAPDSTVVKKITQGGAFFVNQIVEYLNRIEVTNLDEARRITIKNFLTSRKIIVYIDDIDRGWEGQKRDIRKISALLNALRDLSTDYKGLYFRIGLRADVYFLVRTSDESTDKIDGSVIWYKWTNHEIFKILVKRVGVFFNQAVDEDWLKVASQRDMSRMLDNIMEPRFSGLGHWQNAPMYKVLLSLVRRRPRDLVKLCSAAAGIAGERNHDLIRTNDFVDSFENYSQGRLQDTINEYRTELPDIERLLFSMKPSKKERRAALGYQYKTADLLKKIADVQSMGVFRFANQKVASDKDLANFMYKINFLTARKDLDGGKIDRKYFDENRYISSSFVDFGYDWEVHPAYRWALQPDTIQDIFEQLKLSDFEFDEAKQM